MVLQRVMEVQNGWPWGPHVVSTGGGFGDEEDAHKGASPDRERPQVKILQAGES